MELLIRRIGKVVALLALLGAAISHAQAVSVATSTAIPAPAPAPSAARLGSRATLESVLRPSAPLQENAQLRDDLRKMETKITADIATVRPMWWERLIPAGIGLAGVFVGGFFSWLLQHRQMQLSVRLQSEQLEESKRIGRAKAGYESMSKVIDYQTKQVNEFYSPLRLMLRRSSGVRRQLTDQLAARGAGRFIYVNEEADERDHLFIVEPDSTRTRFRLIEHMHELATSHKDLMPLVREIVSIGLTMSELIHTKGGIAVTGNNRLAELLGQYLAHFSILRDVSKKAEETPDLLAELKYNVVYPVELDPALDEDMKTLTDQIDAWKQLSRQMWKDAS